MSDKKISELTTATSINQSDVSVLVSGGVDYKFAFSTLLQFLSTNLTVGANISFGTTMPQNTVGKNGDLFINTTTGSFAQKISSTWNIVYTPPSASSVTDGTVLYGLGEPGTSTGNNNDTYIDTGTGIFYKKVAGAWGQVFSMQTGPQGPQGIAGASGANGTNGFAILNGGNNPSNLSTGVNGDFYINTSNYTFFGPKAAGVWGSGASLVGAGVEAGGTTGQVLTKASNTDYDTQWVNPTSNTDSVTELPGATNKYFTENRVLSAVLSGLSTASSIAIASTDSILQALGKLQAQITVYAGRVLPSGGATGQVLSKINGTDYNAQWIDPNENIRIELTDAEPISWNFSAGNVSYVELSEDRDIVISNVSGIQFGILEVNHGVAGSLINLPGNVEGVNWSNIVDGITLLGFYFNGTDYIWTSNIQGGVIDVEAPVLQEARVDNGALTTVVLAYNELLLSSSIPSPSDFSLSGGKTISAVNISGSNVLITFNSTYTTGTPTISYTGGTNKIKDVARNIAASFSAHPIIVGLIDAVDWDPAGEVNCTDNGSGVLTFNGGGGFAKAATFLGVVGSYVEYINTTQTDQMVMAIGKTNDSAKGETNASTALCVYRLTTSYYYHSLGSTFTAVTGITPVNGDIVRIERTATNDLSLKISQDGGVVFVTAATITNVLSGVTTPTIKAWNTTNPNIATFTKRTIL